MPLFIQQTLAEQHYLNLIDKQRKEINALRQENKRLKEIPDAFKKPVLPEDVGKALSRLNRILGKFLSPKEIKLLLFTSIPIAKNGDQLTLRKFALQNPVAYFQAVANGFDIEEPNQTEQVANMISNWMNEPYGNEDVEENIKTFAGKITDFFSKRHT